MNLAHGATLTALLLISFNGCSRPEASAAVAASTSDGTPGVGHVHLSGQYALEKDFAIDGCQIAPPGDGLLSGYHMTAKDVEPLVMLSVTLKDYGDDGAYVQQNLSSEATVGRAMNSGSLGALTLMVMREAGAPLAFGQKPNSKLTITVSEKGAKGDAEFSDLESQTPMEEYDPKSGHLPAGKRVSGSITWTCGSVERLNAKMNDAVNGMFNQLIPPR